MNDFKEYTRLDRYNKRMELYNARIYCTWHTQYLDKRDLVEIRRAAFNMARAHNCAVFVDLIINGTPERAYTFHANGQYHNHRTVKNEFYQKRVEE